MPPLIKKLVFVSFVSFAAILFGQLYFNGKPIASRVTALVGAPPKYEIIHDTKQDMAGFTATAVQKIPVWFHKARVGIATWLYPSVTGKTQPPRN